jgi:hypothetical protein
MTRVLSYGGGLDSWVMLLDAIARNERPDLAIFADVADPAHEDPGEWPATYAHLRDVVMPLCAREGIAFKWLGTDESPIRGERSLFAYLRRMRLMPSRAGRRMCTAAAKVERIAAHVADRYPEGPIEVWIGFEAGEEDRAARDPHAAPVADGAKPRRFRRRKDGTLTAEARLYGRRRNRFPLMERGICRCRAEQIARASGLPMPPGSACVYCPFGSRGDFQTLARELPPQFEAVVLLEADCRETKAGRTVRFSGTEDDPALAEWVRAPFARRGKPCSVCGAEVKAPKRVGCTPVPDAKPPRQRSLFQIVGAS